MGERTSHLYFPRGLVFLASVWLIASWLLAIGVASPVQPSSASYTPGVRLMLLCIMIGLMIIWPLMRLSQPATTRPIQQTILDLFVLLALVQVVIWPLRLVTPWSAGRTAAIDAVIAGWTLLAAAVVASAIGTDRPGPRILGMLACLGMCALGPAAAWLGINTGIGALELIDLSPFLAIFTLSSDGRAPVTTTQWQWIGLLAAAACACWLGLLIASAFRHAEPPRYHQAMPADS